MILQAEKTNSEPTKEKYDSLIHKLATLKAELGQAREFLEAPGKWYGWRAGGA